MPNDVNTSSSFPSDEAFATPVLNALSIQATDAIAHVKRLFRAYQCLEGLVMPRSDRSVDLTLPDKDLYALLTSLNEPMQRQIDEAQAICNQLLICLKQEQAG